MAQRINCPASNAEMAPVLWHQVSVQEEVAADDNITDTLNFPLQPPFVMEQWFDVSLPKEDDNLFVLFLSVTLTSVHLDFPLVMTIAQRVMLP